MVITSIIIFKKDAILIQLHIQITKKKRFVVYSDKKKCNSSIIAYSNKQICFYYKLASVFKHDWSNNKMFIWQILTSKLKAL